MSTGDHVDLSSGYLGLRVAVTHDYNPCWLHERLLLWAIEPDRFVVLTPDGDITKKCETRGSLPRHDWPTTLPHWTRECRGLYRPFGRCRNASTHH